MKFLFKSLFLSLSILGLSLTIPLSAMEAPSDIPMLTASGPYLTIPTYFFNNPNQGTLRNRSKELLDRLKTSAEQHDIGVKIDRSPQYKDKVATKEEFDWIHGLNFLEKKLLPLRTPELTVEHIQELNTHLTRLIDTSQAFRKADTAWPITQLTSTEKFFQHCITTGMVAFQGVLTQEQVKNTLRKIVPSEDEVRKVAPDFSYAEINTWSNEQEHINIQKWYNARNHTFPPAQEVSALVNTMLLKIKTGLQEQVDPAKAAAYALFEMVRIHPWHEANKRTGRALSAKILLEHGYLPPVITEADTFVALLIQAIHNYDSQMHQLPLNELVEHPHVKPFVAFFVQKTKEAQKTQSK